VKDIVTLFNGEVEVKSEVGIGTSVTFMIKNFMPSQDESESLDHEILITDTEQTIIFEVT
jgi:hypothetical protein